MKCALDAMMALHVKWVKTGFSEATKRLTILRTLPLICLNLS